jgi:predicted N-acyltransferase
MQPARAYSVRATVAASLAEVTPAEWNRLASGDPFLRYEYLSALHDTDCVGNATGWQPQFILLRENGMLIGAMPLYRKTHSYGEYVFDWSWADAYRSHGVRYYPKLVSAIPFTPGSGRRLLAETPRRRELLVTAALDLAATEKMSSLHILFPNANQADELHALGFMLRQGLQFHWRNHNYESFEHFLSLLNHDKRKKIRQERRRPKDAGIAFHRLSGRDTTLKDWRFFNRCYRNTYREHGSFPYLNLDFFSQLAKTMPDNLLLIVAEKDGQPIAGALNIHDEHTLYGRYWGALEHFPGLHFETCYYQAIEFCIAHEIEVFQGGAQGEHKLARGFLPVKTWSAHWLGDPRFAAAVKKFLEEETRLVNRHLDELERRAPFKSSID